MTDTARVNAKPTPTLSDGEPVLVRPAAVQVWESMLSQVPEAGDDAVEAILGQIAAAESISELDAPWEGGGMELYKDTPLTIMGIRRMRSDFAGGLGWYLIVDAAVRTTGERVTFTTSSVNTVAQLVRAWVLNAIPFKATPRRAERPSRNGYYAWHLEIEE